jgi:transcriptional regulator with XRE-family HTH domain
VANDTARRLLARIRALREAHGLTQEAFAERADLSYKHYQQVEAGRKFDIRLSTLIKMADALGVTLRELVDFEMAPAAVAESAGKYAAKSSGRKGVSTAPARRIATKLK